MTALFAGEPHIAEHPAVRAAAAIASDVLAPHAQDADDPARGIDPAHLRLLAEQGLLSVTIPVAEGGRGAGSRIDAEIVELFSGACGATWFLTTQHRFPQALSRGPLSGLPDWAIQLGPAADRYRAELSSSATLGGIAIAHLRRQTPRAPRADPAAHGGWRFTGIVDWCTGWGILDLMMIAGFVSEERFVLALVPARECRGLRAGEELPLAVMGGTRTVALELDALAVDADDVLATIDYPAWREHDQARVANTTPATLGLLRQTLIELYDLGVRGQLPEAVDLASTLAERAAARRREVYALLSDVPMRERQPERAALRGEIAELSVRAANALVVARSGSAMLLSSPEQRRVREAAFHLIQHPAPDVRTAQLAAFAR